MFTRKLTTQETCTTCTDIDTEQPQGANGQPAHPSFLKLLLSTAYLLFLSRLYLIPATQKVYGKTGHADTLHAATLRHRKCMERLDMLTLYMLPHWTKVYGKAGHADTLHAATLRHRKCMERLDMLTLYMLPH